LHKLSWIRLIKIIAWVLIKLSKQPMGFTKWQTRISSNLRKELQKNKMKAVSYWNPDKCKNWKAVEHWILIGRIKAEISNLTPD